MFAARKLEKRKEKLVGTTGFEPATLCSQSRCATRLRHVPTVKTKELKYKRYAANRQRCTGIAECRRTGSGRYESSNPAVFISAISARRAWPRWLIPFFSAVESSAIVFPREGTKKSGS
jgi:hypothetical protein